MCKACKCTSGKVTTLALKIENLKLLIALAFIFWTPHVFLDYQYRLGASELKIVYGQYIFFFLTSIGLAYFTKITKPKLYQVFFDDIWLKISFLLFIFGVLVSVNELWNVRLLVIFLLIAAGPIVAASYLLGQPKQTQLTSIFLIILPSVLPILFGISAEIFAMLFDASLELERDEGGRWRYLHSSANGFGFDAGIVVLTAACFFWQRHKYPFVLVFVGLSAGLTALYQSETRSALLMVIVGLFVVFFTTIRAHRLRFLMLSAVMILVFSTVIFFNDELKIYLRIFDSFERTTSGRSDAVVAAVKTFLDRPLSGYGFGSADLSLPFSPTNLFYVVVPVEIGIFGAAGVFGIIGASLLPRIRSVVIAPAQQKLEDDSELSKLSLVGLIAILTTSIAEFTIFRISAANQLFFFFWAIVYLANRIPAKHQV